MEVISTIDAVNVHLMGSFMYERIRDGGKLMICGCGGSAADSQHFAAELVGRYDGHRQALPAIALTADSAIVTALGNDFGFSEVFARQVRALGNRKDVLVAISTSGASSSVCQAVEAARDMGMAAYGLTGPRTSTNHVANLCDNYIDISSHVTARIQEAHGLIIHLWCELIDKLWKLHGQG